MKKFLYKTAFFVLPFFFLLIFFRNYYTSDKGDLLRLGYIPDIQNYDFKVVFKNEMNRKIQYTLFSEINLKKENKLTVITIGDSFSEQEIIGYKNYLADDSNIKVLHYDRFLHENPIETITGFLNGNVFDNIKVDYIILQSVERGFVERGLVFNKKSKLNIDTITNLIRNHKEKFRKVVKEKTKDKFFCRELIELPLNAIFYNFDDNAYSSKTYQVKTTQNLFSTNSQNLLFFEDDYKALNENNNISFVKTLNNELNILSKRLQERGIKLIVLPCPDKFDFYYDDIVNKDKYTKPLFFETMRSLDKDYIYIDSKKILKEKTKNKKDVYFYDDTHWSPIAAKIIAEEIKDKIN